MPKGFELDQTYPDTPLVARRKVGEQLVRIVANEYSKLAEIAMQTGIPVSLAALRRHFHDFDAGAVDEAFSLAQEQRLFDIDEAFDAVYPPTRFRPSADRFRYM